MNSHEAETPARGGRGWGRGGCTGDSARQGSKVTKTGLESLDPRFKFPGPVYQDFSAGNL